MMKRSIPFMVFFCFLLLAMSTNIYAASPDFPDTSPPAWALLKRQADAPLSFPAFDKIHLKLQQGGSVRVIVRLRGLVDMPSGFIAEGHISDANDVEKQRKAIQKNQGMLENRLSTKGKTKTKKFSHIPFMALEVETADFQVLLDSPEVDMIEEDIPVPPTLSESVPLIGGDISGAFSGYTGSGQTVAILDTGVATSHPVFAGKIVSEACYSTTVSGQSTSVCPNGQNSQTGSGSGINCDESISGCYHGTHVASIAAGSAGVAKNANIIAIQIFANFNNTALSWSSDQILALERVYALRSTYSISSVNMSLGGGGPYSANCDASNVAFKAAVDNLLSVNIATIIATGNNSYTTGISSPGCVSSAISVGATTKQDVVASYSNSSSLVKLLAPGSSIAAAYPGNTYASLNGTSMATPHVAGAWAVMKSRNPGASVDGILAVLSNTGVTITDSRNGVAKPRIKLDTAVTQMQVDPRLQFTSASYSVNENAGTATITISRDISNTGAVSVDWATSNGTAIAGDDYTASSGTLTFADGESGDKTFTVPIIDDVLGEAAETINLTLSNVAGGAVLGVQSTAVLTINADISDLVADGKADILWRNPADGMNVVWFMDGGTRLSSATLTNVPGPWVVTGTGDFDGDGKTDILWRNSAVGMNVIWLMDGGTRLSSITTTSVPAPSTWAVAGVGDFNGDGKADILWRNLTDGMNVVWLMNGGTRISSVTTSVPAPWVVAGVSDFNNDGKADILWRNPAVGMNVIWLMDGGTRSSLITTTSVPAPSAWIVAGVGDFNNDGKADILWRNPTDGMNVVWLMDGGTRSSAVTTTSVPAPWVVAGVNDFNKDGKADILWRNPTIGMNVLWLMDGGTRSNSVTLTNVSTSWQVVGTYK